MTDARKATENKKEDLYLISQVKNAIAQYPKTWQVIKWSLLAVVLTSLIIFTGGLAANPLVGAIVTKSGLLSVLALAPITAGVLLGLWYGALKPLSQWAINRFTSAPVSALDSHSMDASITCSPHRMVTGLGVTKRPDALARTLTEEENYMVIVSQQQNHGATECTLGIDIPEPALHNR